MAQKLKSWGADSDSITQILSWLKQNNYINHQRFANSFAHDKFLFNHWGKRKIQFALSAKHIEAQYIANALDQIDPDQYRQTLLNLLKNKLSLLNCSDILKIKQKLFNFALSKGYEPELIYNVLDQILSPDE